MLLSTEGIFVLQRHTASAKPPQPKISLALSIFDRKPSFHTLQNAAGKSSQAAFVVIPEIPHSDISYIIKFVRKGLYLRAENGKIL